MPIHSTFVLLAIGWTTIENGPAAQVSPNPMKEAIIRFSSIFAGNAELRLAMGYFAAMAVFGKKRSLRASRLDCYPVASPVAWRFQLNRWLFLPLLPGGRKRAQGLSWSRRAARRIGEACRRGFYDPVPGFGFRRWCR